MVMLQNQLYVSHRPFCQEGRLSERIMGLGRTKLCLRNYPNEDVDYDGEIGGGDAEEPGC